MIKIKQTAFTLIELVMVIVILGILAAFALPKFADLSEDANDAVFISIKARFKTAINIVRSKSIANKTAAGYPDVSIEGTCIQVDSGSGFPLVDQTVGVCVPVASFSPDRQLEFLELIASSEFIDLSLFTNLLMPVVLAAPPPPPPPPPPTAIASELPSLLLNSDLTGWVWNKAAPQAVLTSPEGTSFVYNQNTGVVN